MNWLKRLWTRRDRDEQPVQLGVGATFLPNPILSRRQREAREALGDRQVKPLIEPWVNDRVDDDLPIG